MLIAKEKLISQKQQKQGDLKALLTPMNLDSFKNLKKKRDNFFMWDMSAVHSYLQKILSDAFEKFCIELRFSSVSRAGACLSFLNLSFFFFKIAGKVQASSKI